MAMKRVLLVIIVAVLVVTAGCSGAGGGDSGEAVGGDGAMATGEPQPASQEVEGAPDDADGQEALQFRSRSVIRTGTVSLRVQNFEAAQENLTNALESRGGFISDSHKRVHRVDNQTYTTGELVLRVPSEEFSGMLARVEAEGDVLRSDTASQDVTDQLVDIEARLDNLRAQRDRLRVLYDRANDTTDVLRVQRELADVQERIERLEAQQQSLERRVALATIRVKLSEPEPERDTDPSQAWYEVGVLSALVDSMNGVVVVLRALAVGIAYAVPYVVVFGVPILGFAAVWRYRDRWGRQNR